MFCFVILLTCASNIVLAGDNDTLSQLEAGYGNIDMNNVYDKEPVEVVHGVVPKEIEGTLARHGCGVFGHATGYETSRLDRIQHVFDCINIAQAFSFVDGQAFFTSKFYDTAKNDIYR